MCVLWGSHVAEGSGKRPRHLVGGEGAGTAGRVRPHRARTWTRIGAIGACRCGGAGSRPEPTRPCQWTILPTPLIGPLWPGADTPCATKASPHSWYSAPLSTTPDPPSNAQCLGARKDGVPPPVKMPIGVFRDAPGAACAASMEMAGGAGSPSSDLASAANCGSCGCLCPSKTDAGLLGALLRTHFGSMGARRSTVGSPGNGAKSDQNFRRWLHRFSSNSEPGPPISKRISERPIAPDFWAVSDDTPIDLRWNFLGGLYESILARRVHCASNTCPGGLGGGYLLPMGTSSRGPQQPCAVCCGP